MRLLGAFEHFIDIDRLSDVEATQLVRRSEIDIAVDLAGFTQHARTGIFSLRAAPIQIGYLGYPGSMGTDYHDYLVADSVLIPSGMEAQFAEKIVRLPHCYQPNDGKRSVSDREFSREELGLPATGFVFCCFNRAFKLTPETFDSWMRILRRVEGSVLWLSRPDPAAIVRLQLEATARGIDPVRIVFARAMPSPADHLGRQRSAGLFLDTWPFNAHTTASDALWAGLPVLTCIGETLPSRVAASLLTSVGLPELITRSPPEYEELAVRLATHPEELAALRARLALNRSSAPLFDSARLARHLEAAFTQMYERHRTGSAPDDIDIGP
jgi:predicted O-linked N-acetylglucosamine transferase (SPINDLY family)